MGYIAALAAIALSGASFTWHRYSSTAYPYSIEQPSSYRHIVLHDTANQQADYFFPSLGSFTTNVNIYAFPGSRAPNEATYLHSLGGREIHRDGWLKIAGKRSPLIASHFRGIAAHWTMEQTTFVNRGIVWRITASYEDRFRRLRPTLLRMLRSFRLSPNGRLSRQ